MGTNKAKGPRKGTPHITATPGWQIRARDLTERMVSMKDELARLGLYRTMHTLDSATQEIGWEIGEALGGDPENRKRYLKIRNG